MNWLTWSPFQEPNFPLLIVLGSSFILHRNTCLQIINDSIILWFGMIFMIDRNPLMRMWFMFSHLFSIYVRYTKLFINYMFSLKQIWVVPQGLFVKLCDPLKKIPVCLRKFYIKNTNYLKLIIVLQEILCF